MRLRFLVAILALAALLTPPVGAAEIYLVRHAEKVLDESPDPSLSPAGSTRAANLAVLLASAGITRVFSTDFARTRDTAAPTARATGVEIEIYDPKAPETLAARLLKLEENALVVGHSNTIPELVEILGGDGGPPIVEAWEYDRVYLLRTENGAAAGTVLLHLPPRDEGN